MSCYIIEGGKKLEGKVRISGPKNSSLPIIAATILNGGTTTLYNVPNIEDTRMMIKILKLIGAKIEKKKDKVVIDTSKINRFDIPEELMHKMRSSVILAGSLIGKYHIAKFSYPGGCDIGARPIDLHLKSFEKLNINVKQNYGIIECQTEEIIGNKINLDFPSVGATENIILASVLANGITTITNAAREPEIVDLSKFLNKMGAKVKGAGTDTIKIEGVQKLKSIGYNIMPDRIEAGTFLCLAGATNGNIVLENVNYMHLLPVINKLEEAGCKIKTEKNLIQIQGPKRLKAIDVKTLPYPGFPTDMQSIFASMLTTAKGTSIIVENIFENRYKYIQELNKMGAKITVEGKSAVIIGKRKIYGAEVKATDLRGGAALVLAGLMAKGTTKIDNIEYILRGYENLDKKLKELGADIKT